jgi:uncharacterized YigZ family protein
MGVRSYITRNLAHGRACGMLWFMSKRYSIPAGESCIELQVKNSRFIGRAGYTPSVQAARAFIDKVKAEEPGCTHAVYAFAVGHGAAVTHGMSDAGEPNGTAGRPALAVVKGSGLGDVIVVIARYFGGAKLGTGGLVKAYTEAAQLALAALPITEKVERQMAQVVLPYSFYEQARRLVETHHGQVEAEEFAAEVTLRLIFMVDDLPAFAAAMAEATNGSVKVLATPPAASL